MILSFLEVKGVFGVDFVEVVIDFLEVFPKEVLDLSQQRKVKFAINLVPRVRLVLIVPYRMALTKPTKLKKQMEELLEKRMIKPNGLVERSYNFLQDLPLIWVSLDTSKG
ncbi:hypothetical protein CR513_32000, partial [Mucuna pruriens]